MKKAAFIGLIVLAGCTVHRQSDGDVSVRPITDKIGDWHATLATQNNSGVRGSATAHSAGVGSSVAVTIAGAQSGAQHPWHVHRGTCGDDKGIVGGADKYPVLTAGADGNASATATLGVALDENGSYFVNIHRSPTGLGTVVACGSLSH